MVKNKYSIEKKLNKILIQVRKPGRYTGGEFNQVKKRWEDIETKIALVFPDVYEIGMSNLGLAILYEQINQRTDALAERVFSPWVDMEEALRSYDIPLYSLETKTPLISFDIIGISLPYENLYTNTLNILDLAKIPIRAKDRKELHPLVIAGGHAVYNPEPMHAFIDAFVIGEGEEVIHEVINIYQEWKKINKHRQSLLNSLSQIPGVYIPSLYQDYYNSDGTFSKLIKLDDNTSPQIIKRIVPVLPEPPKNFVVPFLDIVHNRIPIEIMRGCTRGCRFCQAGMVTRPVRERPVSEIVSAIDNAIKRTGYEEVGLLSLSSSDYTQISTLVDQLNDEFSEKYLSVSLPSLRIETVSLDLMEALKLNKGSSFTLAPEAATERMRNIINKPISDQQLLETARSIYSRGWTTIKLYFMIGLPTETIEDVEAIIALCKTVHSIGRQTIGNRAKLNIGISTFIPKAHTPFQWEACDDPNVIKLKQNLIKKELKGKNIKIKWVNPKVTILEAVLSRGDRRLANVIFDAWRFGAKFDAWDEHFYFEKWEAAMQNQGLDPSFYSNRKIDYNKALPWDHISIGVHKKFLYEDSQLSIKGKIRKDCRNYCYACGILPTYAKLRKKLPKYAWKCPEST